MRNLMLAWAAANVALLLTAIWWGYVIRPRAERQRGVVRVKLGPQAFQFDTFTQWVNGAQGWFSTLPPAVVAQRRYVALDAAGRPCLIGKDFMRARDENAFPVTVYLIDEPAPEVAHA